MKKIPLFLLSVFVYSCAFCQPAGYWQQEVNYKIDVTLNDTAKTLDGFISMQYFNHSPDTLRFIWIHLWPNAYKNDRTAFTDQELRNGNTDFYFSNDDRRGYINRLDFKADKVAATMEDHPQHQDIIKLWLPKPLAPGSMTTIETPFHEKLPFNFSRGGYINQSFQITQWYPKPAVYDRKGWHEMPYLDQGEFYSEFGSFDVQVTLPSNYVVAATGQLKNETADGALRTLHYVQADVHDFAWFASADYEVLHDTLQLKTHTVDVYAYFTKANAAKWQHSIAFIKAAVSTKSRWIGEYPYPIVTVVEKPGKGDGGGMEYPTITLVSAPTDDKMLNEVINHEVGHNWLYGIIATNERDYPWMDEGMNTYYDQRYSQEEPGDTKTPASTKGTFLSNRIPSDFYDLLLASAIAVKRDQPISTHSEDFSEINYGSVAYHKTAQWMKLLETQLGQPLFDSVMTTYYNRWKFRHPYLEDFKAILQERSVTNVDALFALLDKKGYLEKPAKKDLGVAAFFKLKDTDKHHYIFLSPAVGYNYYDRFMIGAMIHNYTLPSTRLQFFAAPLYATGSKEFNGIGRVGYSWYPGNNGQKVELAVAGEKFTANQFIDSTGKTNYQPFYKIAPSLKYVFANKDPRSHITKFIQWKTFLITETGLSFTRDTIQQLDIISYPKESRYLNQLQFVLENNRKLYPYSGILQAEQGRDFVRLNFTGNYFFNYPKGGGLNVRFFAGKFIYTVDNTFLAQYETDRYHLNMSGPKGYEDYTYSNYFYGRNEFDGAANQQIMNRDGAFKVKTDLLSDKIGKTDDWLTAANFNTSVPSQVNPLELLPVNISLKLFCDVGTYADAWKTGAATGKFLYDAGFQLSLFRNVVNIYFPFLYSKVYRDYFKSTIGEKIFRKNISFSIDLQNFSFRKFFPQIAF